METAKTKTVTLQEYIKSLAEAIQDAQKTLSANVTHSMTITLYQFSTKIHTTLSYNDGTVELTTNSAPSSPGTKQYNEGEILQISCVIEPAVPELRTNRDNIIKETVTKN